jgi:outer membrane protein assembly factor BamD (BamD/ComL family)
MQIEISSVIARHEILESQIILLEKAVSIFPQLSQSDKEFINNQLSVYSTQQIRDLQAQVSREVWEKYYSRSVSATEVENFRDKYLYGNGLEEKVKQLLSEIYFTEAKNKNTLTGYYSYLSDYPGTKRKKEVYQLIEELEYKESIESADVGRMEKMIQKYPNSSFRIAAEQEITKIHSIEFEAARIARSLNAMQDYLRKFPNTHLKKEVYQELEQLTYRQAAGQRDHTLLEKFLQSYPSSLLKDSAQILLKEIYLAAYSDTKKINTLSAYREYLLKYPNSHVRQQAEGEIERIEYKRIITSGNVDQLEKFIETYPNSDFRGEVSSTLCPLYIASIGDRSDREQVIRIAEKIDALVTTPQVTACRDNCTILLFRIDSSEVMRSNNVDAYHDIVTQYVGNINIRLTDIIKKRNRLWREQVVSSSTPDFLALTNFSKAVGDPGDVDLRAALEYGASYLTESITDGIKQAINSYLSKKVNRYDEIGDKLQQLIITELKLSINITGKAIYDALMELEGEDSDAILGQIFEKLDAEEVISMKDVYIKFLDEYNELLELVTFTENGEIRKKIFEPRNEVFRPLPEPKVTFPIFTAIKSRYKVKRFSIPQVIAVNDKGYEVQLYGYLEENPECCPGYDIRILYTKSGAQLTPLTAISIENFYGSINTFTSLDDFIKVGRSVLGSQEEEEEEEN